MIKIQQNIKRFVSCLKTGKEKGRISKKTSRHSDLQINNEKCDQMYYMAARLLHLIHLVSMFTLFIVNSSMLEG